MTHPDVLDWDGAVERLGGSEDVLRSVARVLIEELPGMTAWLREAMAAGDADALAHAAHTLKGSAGTVGAHRVADLARQLEEHGGDGDLAAAAPVWQQLEPLLDALAIEVRARIGAPGTG